MGYRILRVIGQKMYRTPAGESVVCKILEDGKGYDPDSNAPIHPVPDWVLIQHLVPNGLLVWTNLVYSPPPEASQ
jgi:hypothetical protein